jgi:hypothetical protein
MWTKKVAAGPEATNLNAPTRQRQRPGAMAQTHRGRHYLFEPVACTPISGEKSKKGINRLQFRRQDWLIGGYSRSEYYSRPFGWGDAVTGGVTSHG